MSRVVDQGLAVLVVVVAAVYAAFPETVGAALAPIGVTLVGAVLWAERTLPYPAFLVTVFLAVSVVSVLVVLWLARLGYAVVRSAGPRTRRVYRFVTPSTPLGQMATGITLIIALVLGTIYGLPMVLGDLGDSESFEWAEDVAEEGAEGDPVAFDQHDIVEGGTGAARDAEAYERPAPDTDGDRLADDWEEAGETPEGAPLPGADPERMDLYVQVNYGGGTIPLTEEEKAQLRRVWAEMPVENPDGSRGVDVHVVDSPPAGGPLDTQVRVSGTSYEEVHRYYTDRYMGARACRYHQVVVGDIDRAGVAGVGTTPGYAVVVEDREREREGFDVSPRVAVITHELLHNVAGQHTRSGHVEQGWLAESVGPADTRLSDRTADRLNREGFAGSGHFQHDLC